MCCNENTICCFMAERNTERGHLAADVTIQFTVFVVFRTYPSLQLFDGLGLYACTHHSCRSGASFLREEYCYFAVRLELR